MKVFEKLIEECQPPFTLKDMSALQNAFSNGVINAEGPVMVTYYETLACILHNAFYKAVTAEDGDLTAGLNRLHEFVSDEIEAVEAALKPERAETD